MIEIDVNGAGGHSVITILDGARIHRLRVEGTSANLKLYQNLIAEYYPTDIIIIGYLDMNELNELVEFVEEFDNTINIIFKNTIIEEEL